MKNSLISRSVCLGLLVTSAFAQTNFIYDQQSATESTGGGGAFAIQSNSPVGQSFTPQFSTVGFIRLSVGDGAFTGTGATLVVNLRSNSITGPILGTSDPVPLPNRYSGYPDFYFLNPVQVVPQTTYYFDVTATGDPWAIVAYNYNYPGGIFYGNGVGIPGQDLWFREGVLGIPEPSSLGFGLAGASLLAGFHWRQRRLRQPRGA